MKKIAILVLLLILTSFTASAQQKDAGRTIKVELSETVELMGILSRTAGLREYNMDLAGQYTQDTEAWFAPYKGHPVIAYYQGLHNNNSISYDAVMSMAVHLEIVKGEVKFVGDKTDLEKRWSNVNIEDFMVRINQFYTDTRFHKFFTEHRAFYDEALKTYEANVMTYFHQDWYPKFYGTEPTEKFRVVIGFTNGGGNYGTNRHLPGQAKEVFAICGYYIDPKTGKAFQNGAELSSTLIHEFNHSFVNPLLENEANNILMMPIGQKLHKLSALSMERQAYTNWQTVINESIVRAAVIVYMMEQGYTNKQIQDELISQLCRDFSWMPELVTALRHYASHRNQYKTLHDFYPEITNALSKYLENEIRRAQEALK